MPARSKKSPPRPPRAVHLYFPIAPKSKDITSLILFVEDGGLRIDNLGPLPKNQVERLVKYCEHYLLWTRLVSLRNNQTHSGR